MKGKKVKSLKWRMKQSREKIKQSRQKFENWVENWKHLKNRKEEKQS